MVNSADYTLSVEESDVLLNRIDAVIFFVDFDTRSMGIEIKTGAVASTPAAPALVRTDDRYEMCLAQISVPKQTEEITTAMITDTRGNSELCGFVQGLIQQVDTTTLFQQWQSAFETWFSEIQSEFRSGLSLRKLEGVYITQQANEVSFNVKTYVPQFSFAYDILEVYINGMHLNSNEYTLSNNTVTLETPIEEAGATVTFVVYQSVNPNE